MPKNNFISERNQIYTQKIQVLLAELPPFCSVFFRGIQDTTTPLTRYGYALDLRTFFQYLVQANESPTFFKQNIIDINLLDLQNLTSDDIERFMSYLSLYTSQNSTKRSFENRERAKSRKLSCLRAMLKYFVRKGELDKNVASLVDAPKLREKDITRLEPNEAAQLLDIVESGESLTTHQKHYHQRTHLRDTAIMTVFLSTGIRISELVGLNISDINFDINGFRVTRKGGAQVILYFNDELEKILREYLTLRNTQLAQQPDVDALFLSMQNKRITPRAVQNLVKKYASTAAPLKKISPHKLRSTFGTMLYQQTGDIYLVADVLGHSDVNTTKKHYAAQSDQNRRHAAQVIRIRDDRPVHDSDE